MSDWRVEDVASVLRRLYAEDLPMMTDSQWRNDAQEVLDIVPDWMARGLLLDATSLMHSPTGFVAIFRENTTFHVAIPGDRPSFKMPESKKWHEASSEDPLLALQIATDSVKGNR